MEALPSTNWVIIISEWFWPCFFLDMLISSSDRVWAKESHTTYFNPWSFFVNTNLIIYSIYSKHIIYSCSSNLSTYLSWYDVFCNFGIKFDGAHGGCAILLITTVYRWSLGNHVSEKSKKKTYGHFSDYSSIYLVDMVMICTYRVHISFRSGL